MYEELRKPFDDSQVEGYLKRIGLPTEKQEPTLEYLNTIIRAQLRHIPFDCADVWAKHVTPSTATDDLYDKIITRKRGGYCFELNSLFCHFLKALGFDCYLVIIHLSRPGVTYPGISHPAHCGVVLNIDGAQHFADVGLGGPLPDGSIPMDGTEVLGCKQIMRGPYTVIISKNKDGGWDDKFTFKNMPADPAEIVPLNFYVSQRPNSTFAADLKLNLREDNGSREFGQGTFKYKKNGEIIVEKTASTEEEVKAIAAEYFGIPDIPTRAFDTKK